MGFGADLYEGGGAKTAKKLNLHFRVKRKPWREKINFRWPLTSMCPCFTAEKKSGPAIDLFLRGGETTGDSLGVGVERGKNLLKGKDLGMVG